MDALNPQQMKLREETREFFFGFDRRTTPLIGWNLSAEIVECYRRVVGPVPSGSLTHLRNAVVQNWPRIEPVLRAELEKQLGAN